jgi:quinol monooxygenase YgiN
MTGRVTVTAVVRMKGEVSDKVRGLLAHLVTETRKEAGCIDYVLHRSADEPGAFLFYENWVTREALDRHMETPHFLRWRTEAAELLAGPPEVKLWEKVE